MARRKKRVTIDTIRKAYMTPGHPTAFSSPGAAYMYFKKKGATFPMVEKALSSVDGYSIHKELRRARTYNPYYVYYRRQQIQADLIDIQKLKGQNQGTSYLLALIDSFTRYLWVYPLKSKHAKTVLQAFTDWLEDIDIKPKSILTDKGTEFYNAPIDAFLNSHGIQKILANQKAWRAERVNKTIQVIIYKYLYQMNTSKYVNVLSDLVKSYNRRPHRALDFLSPHQAEQPQNQEFVRTVQVEDYAKRLMKNRKLAPKFKVGDMVRINKHRNKITSRAYSEQQHYTHYVITSVRKDMAVPVYYIKVKDTNEDIIGAWYGNELAFVSEDVDYKIESVIDTRGQGNNLEYLVKWQDFGPQWNTWIAARTLETIRPDIL